MRVQNQTDTIKTIETNEKREWKTAIFFFFSICFLKYNFQFVIDLLD